MSTEMLRLLPSTVDRVGENKKLPVRSKPSDPPTGATRRAARPEKTDWLCEEQLGFGTAKEVKASGVVTVLASTLLVPSQALATRAYPMSRPFYFPPHSF